MNKQRRKQIQEIHDKIYDLTEEIRSVASDEQEYVDNMPENLHGGEKHSAAEDAAAQLEDAADTLDGVLDILEEAQA